MPYSSVGSQYISRKITQTTWKDRRRVDDLIAMYGYIRDGYHSFAAALHFSHLKNVYPDDFLALLEEISPEAHAAELAKQEAERKAAAELHRRRSDVEATLHDDWMKAGGKP